MYILSINSGPHDSAAAIFDDYKLLAAVQKERLTRVKCDGRFPYEAIEEVLDIAGLNKKNIDVVCFARNYYPTSYLRFPSLKKTRYQLYSLLGKQKYKDIPALMRKKDTICANDVFNKEAFVTKHGFRKNIELYFYNHHFAHALSAFFYTKWDNALIYTADGGGDNVHYSFRTYKNNKLTCLYGDDREFMKTPARVDSLGLAYGFATQALGFRMNRHEGKLTGLAAYGKPTLFKELANHFTINKNGEIFSDFSSNKDMRQYIHTLFAGHKPEDCAASIQLLLEEYIFNSIKILVEKHQLENLALAGGVFANVRLNRKLCEELPIKEIFIFPAMGDEGLVVGGALEFLLDKNGLEDFTDNRYKLENVYLGRNHCREIDLIFSSHPNVEIITGNPAKIASSMIAKGKIGAIFSSRMEFGPRALGARSIIASPEHADVNQSLNDRLNRTEFMPFAPYILEQDAKDVFDINNSNEYACKFMTITTNVKTEWRDKIPAVVHVDGTARPQIIDYDDNPLYANILASFKQETGLPVLVNTSFNAHEEPIINTPEECLQALLNDRVDFIVTTEGVYLSNKDVVASGSSQ